MEAVELRQLAGGALQEKAQEALEAVFRNMQDPNTPWKNRREVVIRLAFTQDEDRHDVTCEISVDRKLAQPKPVMTKFDVGTDLTTGEIVAQEYSRGIRGQMSIGDYRTEGEKTAETQEENGVVDFRNMKKA